jgi:hypothetical protein
VNNEEIVARLQRLSNLWRAMTVETPKMHLEFVEKSEWDGRSAWQLLVESRAIACNVPMTGRVGDRVMHCAVFLGDTVEGAIGSAELTIREAASTQRGHLTTLLDGMAAAAWT